ncbi:uncharacterized protein LOC143037401 [Oratosquilla oratoria]|uniref:uncharacterized protein LOC143037401 n=1 Tax=Oratosquilla oratoria TaxID=337810 RepID=UPI003F7672AA
MMRSLTIVPVLLSLFGVIEGLDPCPCKVEPSKVFPGTTIVNCMDKNISQMPTQCFDTNVSEIDISYNTIRAIRVSDLKHTPHLKIFIADFSGLKFIDESAFSQVPELTSLSLEGNKDLYLLNGVFRGLHNISSIVLHGSSIGQLPDMSDLTNLRVLDLRKIELAHLRRPTFPRSSAPNCLAVFSHNYLTDVAVDILLTFPRQTTFNFDYNVLLWAQNEEERQMVLDLKWDFNISMNRLKVCGKDGLPEDPGMCDE